MAFRRLSTLAVAALLLASGAARGDVVILKSGWKAEGVVTETPSHVVVMLRSGLKVRYAREKVARIVRKLTPAQEFENQYKAVDRRDLKALKELATWCQVRGLGPQAAKVAADILAIKPKDAFAKSLLIRHKMAREDREKSLALTRTFAKSFHIHRTRHFRVCYSTDSDYATERSKVFESLYEQFCRHFDDMGLRLRFLEDRLEVVLFRSRRRYVSFAARQRPLLAMSAGFYSLEDGRAYSFDPRSDAAAIKASKQRLRLLRELRRTRNLLSHTRRDARFTVTASDGSKQTVSSLELRRRINDAQQNLDRSWRVGERRRRWLDISTAQHCCAYQLSFALGVLPRRAGVAPRWLAGGIATYFEKADTSPKAKATGENDRRLRSYRRLGSQVPMTATLTDDKPFTLEAMLVDPVAAEIAYAQAWALFRYLSLRRPRQLAKYLETLWSHKGAPPNPQQRIAMFEKAFGPVAQVEKDLRAFTAGAGGG